MVECCCIVLLEAKLTTGRVLLHLTLKGISILGAYRRIMSVNSRGLCSIIFMSCPVG
jgi:hypothetical protein